MKSEPLISGAVTEAQQKLAAAEDREFTVDVTFSCDCNVEKKIRQLMGPIVNRIEPGADADSRSFVAYTATKSKDNEPEITQPGFRIKFINRSMDAA